jgi:hypothetical protein
MQRYANCYKNQRRGIEHFAMQEEVSFFLFSFKFNQKKCDSNLTNGKKQSKT